MASGYLDTPWPCEDGGPERLQRPRGDLGRGVGLGLRPGERLACTTRHTLLSTMTVLGAPGEVYLLTHSALRARVGLPTTACVERLDPITLRAVRRSPRLAGGPMWPGGMAVHRSGALHVVYGRWAHRLDRECQPEASRCLPEEGAYNSFVVLDDGVLVTKNLSESRAARLTVLDPHTLETVCEVVCPEPSIARLSSTGHTLYVVGVRSIFRYQWDPAAARLALDDSWRFDYAAGAAQTYGWDVVLAGGHAWFMDNGKHTYFRQMIGAGVGPGPNRLHRVSLDRAADAESLEVSGQPFGSITNPPLYDPGTRTVVAYDSANRHLRALRWDGERRMLSPLWEKGGFGCASHLVYYPDTGELVINDYRRGGEEVVVLELATGSERGRTRVGGLTQGVVFPSAGFGRDLYWCSMGKVARVFVEGT